MSPFLDPRGLLKKHNLRPKKSWGQNFLVDQDVLMRIVDLIGPKENDSVVEFGAGTGVLTAMLLERAQQVFAVERDGDMLALLQEEFADEAVEVIAADAARFSIEKQLPQSDKKYLVAGNLPYQITTPILFNLLKERHLFHRAVFMVQKEVAQRLTAQPKDGKSYAVLSVRFGAFFHIKYAFSVSRDSFHPKPRVESAIIVLEPREKPLAYIPNEKWFARTVKVSFAQRRKTLQNNLQAGFPQLSKPQILSILESLEISPSLRGETLEISQFAQLAIKMQEAVEAVEAQTQAQT